MTASAFRVVNFTRYTLHDIRSVTKSVISALLGVTHAAGTFPRSTRRCLIISLRIATYCCPVSIDAHEHLLMNDAVLYRLQLVTENASKKAMHGALAYARTITHARVTTSS
jgi:hypothetical protein